VSKRKSNTNNGLKNLSILREKLELGRERARGLKSLLVIMTEKVLDSY
jgi:hypothetical protein